MIIYKRKMTSEDLNNLNKDEEIIYYKSDSIAVLISQHKNRYIARKKSIQDNETIDEAIVTTIDEVMEFVEKQVVRK